MPKGNEPTFRPGLIKALYKSKLVAPLGGKRMKKELKASANLRYGSELRDLKKERRISRRQEKRSSQWFEDYQNKISDIQGQTAGNYAQAQTDLTARSSAASAQDASQQSQMESQRMAQAASTGATYNPTPGNTLSQASSARRTQSLSNQSRVGAQGINQNAYLGGKQLIAAGAGIQAKLAQVDRRNKLREDTRVAKKEKGAYKTDLRRELRGGERQFLSDLLSNKQGRKQLQETIRSNKVREALAERRLDDEEGGRTPKEIRLDRAKDHKAQKQERQEIFSWLNTTSQGLTGKDGPFKGQTPHGAVKGDKDNVVDQIVIEYKIDKKRARVLVDKWLQGKLPFQPQY
jgi:hypothetical protein